MASNVSGTPQENPPSWAKTAGAKSSGDRKDSELPGTPRSVLCETSSGDFLDPTGESEMRENVVTNFQANLGQMKRSLCSLVLCPALWTWLQCHPGETLLAASPTWS
ncbi:Jupiter microtubule associated homolog 1 [Lemmus lemmus]